MEKVSFICPQCGNGVEALEAYRGREITCLACEQPVKVPVNAPAGKKKKKVKSAGDQIVDLIKVVIILGALVFFYYAVVAPFLE